MKNKTQFETIPEQYSVAFVPETKDTVAIYFNGKRFGDTLKDNSYEVDYYRYHDVFHFSFATVLGWSPCIRHLLGLKRKSNKIIDEVEDGARARSIEEGISAIIFEEALNNDFFSCNSISSQTLNLIAKSVKRLEVGNRSLEEWKEAISKAYTAFRFLVENGGGLVEFDSSKKTVTPKNAI